MTVAVLQAGSWGTTLATILARDGQRDVVLWPWPKQLQQQRYSGLPGPL